MKALAGKGKLSSGFPVLAGLSCVIGVLLAFYLLFINFLAGLPPYGDFPKFYASAQLFWEGKDIYSEILLHDFFDVIPEDQKAATKSMHPNLNPPVLTLLFAPLGKLDYAVSFWVWSLVSLLCGIGAVFLLMREIKPKPDNPQALLVCIIVFLLNFPTLVSVWYGQLSLLIFFLVSAGWFLARSGKDRVAGMLLGLAFSIKWFVGFFLILFIVLRRWRLMKYFVGAFLLLSIIPLLTTGADSYLRYFEMLQSITWYGASWNASFLGFFSRIFGGSENVPFTDIPVISYSLAYVLSLVLVFFTAWVGWLRTENKQEQFNFGFAFCIVAMLLISPLGWMYYFPLLLIPAVVIWRYSSVSPMQRQYKVLLVLAWVFSTLPHLLIPSASLNNPVDWFTRAGSYFYALLLFVFILLMLWQEILRRNNLNSETCDAKLK